MGIGMEEGRRWREGGERKGRGRGEEGERKGRGRGEGGEEGVTLTDNRDFIKNKIPQKRK